MRQEHRKYSSRHPMYPTWYAMNARCLTDRHPSSRNYHDRGITVCDRWNWEDAHAFEAFVDDIQLHLGERPSCQHSLDRKENDKGYSIDNLRWATRSEQNLNSRPSRRLKSAAGEIVAAKDISLALGGGSALVGSRLRNGWSLEAATTTPKWRRSPERDQHVLDRYAALGTVMAVHRETGLGAKLVRHILHSKGIDTSFGDATAENLAKVARLRGEGLKFKDIAAELGIAASTARDWYKRSSIE